MRYHDYHLSKYEVVDRGEKVIFHLVYGYPGEETDYSRIEFSEVAFYKFIHTGNAIITEIYEISIPELVTEVGDELKEWQRMYGLKFWESDLGDYSARLQENRYKAWRIEAAIGFGGFVIAREVKNA